MKHLDFIKECYEFGEALRLPLRITEEGELLVGRDYDREAAEAWRELSGDESKCLDVLELWDADPIGFLLNRVPMAGYDTNVRIAADWAAHAWEYSRFEPPDLVKDVIRKAKTPLRDRVADMKDRLEALQYDDRSIRNNFDFAGKHALSAVQTIGWGWVDASEIHPNYFACLVSGADHARAAAADCSVICDYDHPIHDPRQAEAELRWQIGHFVRAHDAIERRAGWPAL